MNLRERLHIELLKKQEKNPSYSLRAFAKFLGVNPTTLSLFLNGKRNISSNTLQKIVEKLQIDEGTQQSLCIEENNKNNYEELNFELLSTISDWFYFAILSLAETDGFKGDPRWIAKRLNISLEQAKTAFNRLIKYQLLVVDGEKIRPSGKQLATTDQIMNMAVRRNHLQALDLARNSIENVDVEKRNFSAMTIATTPEKLEEAADKIRKFRRKITKFLESGEKKEVYRLSIQLFPLSH